MYVKLAVVVLVLIVQRRVDATDPADIRDTSSQERPLNVQKRRLSIQDTGRPKNHVSISFLCLTSWSCNLHSPGFFTPKSAQAAYYSRLLRYHKDSFPPTPIPPSPPKCACRLHFFVRQKLNLAGKAQLYAPISPGQKCISKFPIWIH